MRRTLEEAGAGCVLAVPKSQQLHALFGRLYDWAAARLAAIGVFDGDRPTHERWVLARRRLAPPERDRLLPRPRTRRHRRG
ncbi:hypothetical protein ACL07V_36405 [Streptomyces sp. MB22_4]|uniref:hypothetical protein n=1 Tax=Streptomyces sp. MB22_4 TaxID=3383120 RepID=UPI0039A18E3B